MRQPKAIRELPSLRQTRDGIAVAGDMWELSRGKGALSAWVYMAAYQTSYVEDTRRQWKLTIVRRSRNGGPAVTDGKWFEVSIAREDPDDTSDVLLLAFKASGWREAVAVTQCDVDVVDGMRRCGVELYGDHRGRWHAIRPFKIQYPYVDPDEPNAKYSSYKFCGRYLTETDGAIVMMFGFNNTRIRDYVRKVGGNAFLDGPDDEGKYHIYHRGSMTGADEIDLDDWRARIIAGCDN